MKTCRSLSEAKHWAELGSHVPLPDGLRAHAAGCGACAELVQTVVAAREFGRQLPVTPLEQEQHDAVRFRLMAAARQGAGSDAPSGRRVHFGVRLLLVAVVVTASAAAAKFVLQTMRNAPGQASTTGPNAARRLPQLKTYEPGASPEEKLSVITSAFRTESSSAAPTPDHSPAPAPTTAQSVDAAPASNIEGDARFAEAWAALRSKRPAEAAKHFDDLLSSNSLDAARRADILYWSAQAHRQAGHAGAAQNRSSQLLRQYPSSPFASDAALILGEYALASDRFDTAAQFLNKAATSDRPEVRERAKRALAELVQKSSR